MSKRYRICRKIKGHKKKKCWFVKRNKKGRITDVTNIGRSTRIDTRVKAKRKIHRRHRNIGHLGDYRKRR